MKNIMYTLAVVMFSFTSVFVQAQHEINEKMDFNFTVSSHDELEINTSFANVTVQSWDKNEVYVEVDLMVKSYSEKRCAQIREKLQVEVDQNSSGVEVRTELNSVNLKNKNSEIDINVFIKAPNSMTLNGETSFGDLDIPDWKGNVDVYTQFGDLTMGKLLHENSKVEIQYGDLRIESADILDLRTSFSGITLGEIKSLELDSQYDELDIEEIFDCEADCQFSDIDIERLLSKLELDNQYGGVEIDFVKRGFEIIEIDNQFGEVELEIEDGSGYDIEVELSFGSFNCDCKSKLNHKEEGFNNDTYWGTVGDGSGKIVIESSFGGVKVK